MPEYVCSNDEEEYGWGSNIRRQAAVAICFDANDMAWKDQRRAERKAKMDKMRAVADDSKEVSEKHMFWMEFRDELNTLQAEDWRYQQEINRLKSRFGNDDRAEKMARTLKKLQVARERGKTYKSDDAPTEEAPVAHDRKRASFYK